MHIHPSIHRSIDPSIHRSIHPSIHPSHSAAQALPTVPRAGAAPQHSAHEIHEILKKLLMYTLEYLGWCAAAAWLLLISYVLTVEIHLPFLVNSFGYIHSWSCTWQRTRKQRRCTTVAGGTADKGPKSLAGKVIIGWLLFTWIAMPLRLEAPSLDAQGLLCCWDTAEVHTTFVPTFRTMGRKTPAGPTSL